MPKIRYAFIALCLMCPLPSQAAEVSIGIQFDNVNIGINVPTYPELVPMPGYPVYYAPQLEANFFFYDGMYWIFQNDNWYTSNWYNGPWGLVNPEAVPLFVLRIPVRYYRQPPTYFIGWRTDEPPRWGDHWGPAWAQHRNGWDRWDHHASHPAAPLPVYQREFSGNRYPRQVTQQHQIQEKHYQYRSNDPAVQKHYPQQGGAGRPEPRAPSGSANPRPHEMPQGNPPQQERAAPPHAQHPQQEKPPRQHEPHPQQQKPQGEEHRNHEGGNSAPEHVRNP